MIKITGNSKMKSCFSPLPYQSGEWLAVNCKACNCDGCKACSGNGYRMVWHRIEVKYIPEPHPGIQTEKRNDHV